MDFERSTQAKSWMFDEAALAECKQKAVTMESVDCGSRVGNPPRVRKFASGFATRRQRQRQQEERISAFQSVRPDNGYYENSSLLIPSLRHPYRHHSTSSFGSSQPEQPILSCADQDVLVHFHAHQIQRLVGPNAILPELQRSSTVLSTAITIFRRFYLSNSVIDFHPRNIATASALLAVKVDCETKLEINLLSYATSIVNQKANKAPLCREELKIVTVDEIESAERALLEGLNYELRCHHPFGAIRVLASDLANYLASSGCEEEDHAYGTTKAVTRGTTLQYGYRSPTTVHECFSEERVTGLCERAVAIAQSALVYSDVNFLFPPGQIAFAAVSVALEGNEYGGRLGSIMGRYLRMRFPQKTQEELYQFEWDVSRIICNLAKCPEIDLNKYSCGNSNARFFRRGSNPYHQHQHYHHSAQHQAAEVRRVFAVAASIRFQRASIATTTPTTFGTMDGGSGHQRRKRAREEFSASSPRLWNCKAAKVTPIHTPLYG